MIFYQVCVPHQVELESFLSMIQKYLPSNVEVKYHIDGQAAALSLRVKGKLSVSK